jgi:hypothetical protein
VVAVLRALVWLLLIGSVVTSCSTTDRSRAMPGFPPEANSKFDLASLEPGVIVITPGTNAAEIAAAPPSRRVEPVSEGAADATRSFLNTPNLGNPQLEAGVGAVQFALAPFAAAYGAISASQKRLSAIEASEAQQRLVETMSSNALPEKLVQSSHGSSRGTLLRDTGYAPASAWGDCARHVNGLSRQVSDRKRSTIHNQYALFIENLFLCLQHSQFMTVGYSGHHKRVF